MITELLDQPYSNEFLEHRVMDIFLPGENSKGRCLFFVHGGGFTAGKKEQWNAVARHFCELGFTCASVEYRLAPKWQFPCQIEDVRLAMSYLNKNASQYKFEPQEITAIGSSAGGHLVLMLATISQGDTLGQTSEMLELDTRPKAVICYCPVVTVHLKPELWTGREEGLPGFVTKFMGKEEADAPDIYKLASPIDRIKGGEPPMLFIHGDVDTSVPLYQSIITCEKIRSYGGSAELVTLKGVKHGFGYGVITDAQKQAVKLVEEFLNK